MASAVGIQTQELTWETQGEVAVAEGMGGSKLRFRSGVATLRDTELRDGSVSFVLKAPRARSFVGLRIRQRPDGGYEHFYL